MVRLAIFAEVVKLVDTLASGASGGNPVEVQVLSSAPYSKKGPFHGAFFCLNITPPTSVVAPFPVSLTPH